jgi:hypothetical protein|eukprot:COSAG06_NODE_2605_length_6590_cov_2.260360_8_plen_66_part_00
MRRDKTQNLKEELAPRVVEACGAKNAPSVSPLPMLVPSLSWQNDRIYVRYPKNGSERASRFSYAY